MKTDKKIIHAIAVICLLFFLLILYLTYFEFFVGGKIIYNSYNQRLKIQESNVLRGSILDRNGKPLAESRFNGKEQERLYPFGSLYSHIIGYNSKIYGKSLLEASCDNYLSNRYEGHAIMDITAKIEGYEPAGASLHLTVDHELQSRTEKLMRNLKGAAIAMNPKTGEILAMVSKPDYDPNSDKLESNWRALVESPDSPFLPRATQGMYPPGSTFKVVISAGAVENGMSGMKFEDKGTTVIDGKEFSNAGGKAYGNIDIKSALAVSSNTFFATLGVEMGYYTLKNISLAFGLEKDIPFDLPLSKSGFPYKEMSKTDMASVGIGQGKILTTPLQMAMIASCIANDGIIMKPYLVKEIRTVNGILLKETRPSQLFKSIESDTARAVRDMMVDAVKKGTGGKAGIKGISVAGKTGTAQNESARSEKEREHAWFIGFAPADDPEIAVAIVAEFSGSSGGDLCAPIARKLIETWLTTD